MWYKYAWLCVVLHVCACSRVLVVFPMSSRSHTTLGDCVVTALLAAGHNVTYVVSQTQVKPNDQLRVIDISSANNEQTDASHPRLLDLVTSPRPPHRVLLLGVKFAERALRHPNMQALMRDPGKQFDVVVAEWFYTGLLAPLAAIFQCPLIWYSAVDASWMNLQLVHEPASPLLGVDLQATARAAASYSVPDRIHRIWRQAYLSGWIYYMTKFVESPLYYEIYQLGIQQRGGTPALYEDLVYNASLLLVNSSPLLGQGLPLPENAKYVGGHHLQDAEPLPKNLKTILDNAKYGAIYFSLGSTIKSEDMTEEMTVELLKVFRQLEQTVIWKFEGHLEHLPSNVHVVKWAPQQSILRHPKLLMMISHGGFMSYMEAMYNGVPIIGIPLFGDQFLTMDIAQARGRGIKVLFTDHLASSIKKAINKILEDYSYRSNAREASFIMHQRLVPPSTELVHWVELVVSTRGAPHLRSAALDATLVERLHLDVMAVLLMVFWFLQKVARLVKVYWDDWGTDCDDKKTR